MDIGKHGDNGVGTHNRIDAQSVYGVGIHHSPLYGHTISNLTAQGCGVGFGCWDFTLKGVIIKPYFERNNFDWVVFNYFEGTIIEPLMDIENMVFMVSRFLYGKSGIGSTQIINDDSIKVKSDFRTPTNPGSIDLEMGRNNAVNLVNTTLDLNLMNTRTNELLMSRSTTLNVTISPGTQSVINFTTENDIEDAPDPVTLYSDSTLEIFKGVNDRWKVNVFRTNYNVRITNIPNYVGQTTVHNTRPYIAVGTSSVDDWKEITIV